MEQRGIVPAVLGEQRCTHGAGHRQLRRCLLHHGAEGLRQQLAAIVYQIHRGDILQEHHEFIAADASDNVLFTEQALQRSAHLRQHRVTVEMTVGIVDGLKIIQIQHQQRRELTAAAGHGIGDELLRGGLVE